MSAILRKKRRGYILAETVVAALILGAILVATVTMLGWAASQRRATERRGWAAQEASNAMDALCALPFAKLSQQSAESAAKLSETASDVLPGGRIEVRVSEEPPMKRIDLEVKWMGTSGLLDRPVRLTAWVADKGAQP